MGSIAHTLIDAYRTDPSAPSSWEPSELFEAIRACDDHYYNTASPLVSDGLYDVLVEIAKTRSIPLPNNVGAAPNGQTEKLPLHCGSADKIKAKSKELERFLRKFIVGDASHYVLSDKLDGMSATYWRDARGHHLTSRGDGTEGTVWDHLLPFLKLPALAVGEVVRGEVLISLSVFESLAIADKKSARHTTAGLVNKFERDPNWQQLEFVAFGFPSMDALPSEQLETLSARGFNVVWWQPISVTGGTVTQTMEELEEVYAVRRAKGDYQIDGLIVTADVEHEPVAEGNPVHMAAFKMPLSEQMAETVVEYIEWNLSRYNFWIPRIKVKPVVIGGATYNWCHGENARAIVQEGIGSGARVVLLRSGDVIPDIYDVVERTQPQMPDGVYEWTETGVDLRLPAGERSETGEIKQLSFLLTSLGMAGMKIGTVKRLYNEGYTTLKDLLTLDKRALLDVPGIQDRSADTLLAQFERLKNEGVLLYKMMAASAVFGRGFGETKARSVLAAVPELVNLQPFHCNATIVQRVTNADDFSDATAERFVEDWPEFLGFMAELPMLKVVTDVAKSGILDGEVIVFTEFRNADLQDLIEQEGGQVGGSVTKKTTRVVTVNPTGNTTKLQKAREQGLPVQTPQDFAKEFGLNWA